jgi:SAM-dependent methyltransferase
MLNNFKRLVTALKRWTQSGSLRLLSRFIDGGFAIFIGKPNPRISGAKDCDYIVAEGRSVPVYRDYRYSIKAGWKEYPGLACLAELKSRNRLTQDESNFLRKAIGYRTVSVPSNETTDIAWSAIDKNRDLFLESAGDDKSRIPEFKPDIATTSKLVNSFSHSHAAMLLKLESAGVYSFPTDARVLEIGYTTGGHSILAFEELGYKVFGIDNYYDGLLSNQKLHQVVADIYKSRAVFEIGDITKTTSFSSESMDVVFSTSVLEHIQNLPGAFKEMFRVLKPGGAIIHNYAPYFSPDGGHALGIGDSPWVHVRLNHEEYLRYLESLRPYEYPYVRDWINDALHRDMPQWKMQRLISTAGFRIALWVAKPAPKAWLKELTTDIVQECFTSTPEIGIEDLISRSVSFVAIKPL